MSKDMVNNSNYYAIGGLKAVINARCRFLACANIFSKYAILMAGEQEWRCTFFRSMYNTTKDFGD
jgi:hypothetical protein